MKRIDSFKKIQNPRKKFAKSLCSSDGISTSLKHASGIKFQRLKCLQLLFLGIFILNHLTATENFFILWGTITHSDETSCVHRPLDSHFPRPNQLSYVAYFEGRPETIITEQSPKWNFRDDPTLPGNGYFGIEIGNLHEDVPEHSDKLLVSYSCYGVNEQVTNLVNLRDLKLRHQQHEAKLKSIQFPNFHSALQVNRENGRNIIEWSGRQELTYNLYRTNLTDTLPDGRPKRVYQRIAEALNSDVYTDHIIDSTFRYGYIAVAEDESGRQSGHSPEVVDVPIDRGPITHVAPFSDGSVAVTYTQADEIVIIDDHGKEVATLTAGTNQVIAVDRNNHLWVVQNDLEEVNVYSPTGKMIKNIPWSEELLENGKMVDLSIGKKSELYILTEKGMNIFSPTLQSKGTLYFEDGIASPTSISMINDQIAVAFPVEHKVEIYRHNKGKIQNTGTIFTNHSEPWGVQWLNTDEFAISDPFLKSVTVYSTNGNMIGLLEQSVISLYGSPRAITRHGDELFIADGQKVFVLPAKFPTPTFVPEVTFSGEGEATLTWRSWQKTESSVRFWINGDDKKVISNPIMMGDHSITLKDLMPVTRIDYEITAPLRTIPPTLWSMSFDFVTPLWESGKTAVLKLPLAVILHTHAIDIDNQLKGHPATTPISADEVARIRNEIEDAVLFYWHNSRMKLFLDVDFFTSDEFWDVAPFGEHPAPDLDRVKAFLSSRDYHLSDYVGILRIIAEQRYDEEKNSWVIAGRGGGFTWGINPIDNYPGVSWWRATPAVESSGNNWLFVHEYHHQLDAMFQESGHPEYPFNHFSPMEYAGPFGEHYDGNAYILRQGWHQNDWFLSRWGEKLLLDDKDGDGIPDNSPFLPSDEIRLGSHPDKKDSDNDGLDDLNEVLLSNWVVHAVGEDWGPPVHFPNLLNPDIDGDGLKDGEDPLPLYSLDPGIVRRSPTIDGYIQKGEWPFIHDLQDDLGSGEFYFCWDSDFLYGAVRVQPLAPFHLQIDANIDGWFVGRDNLVFRFFPNLVGDEPNVETNVFVCDMQPEKYPHMDSNLFPAELIVSKDSVSDDLWTLEFAIPKNEALGLRLEEGDQIGINAGYYFDKTLRRRVSLFEPNRIIYLTLKQ